MHRFFIACLCALAVHSARAEPLVPRSDDEVVETLPAAAGRAEDRRLRRDWAAHPDDPARAVALSRRHLGQARSQGDPRHAGQALATPRLPAASSAWLLTTLAELEVRAGRVADADAAYGAALAADADGYTVLSYADFLIEQGRAADALARLASEPRSDAVLLRLAI